MKRTRPLGSAFMKIGFTGTRKGMTRQQELAFSSVVSGIAVHEFHHGDCKGADEQAHNIILNMRPVVIICVHPPDQNFLRAYCRHPKDSLVSLLPEKPFLERNHDIVDVCNLLIACPVSDKEERRSGTWATMRYARQRQKLVLHIRTDGDIGFYQIR